MKTPLDLLHDLKFRTLVKVALITGIFGLLATIIAVGRYDLAAVGFGATEARHPIAYRLDKWTGKTWLVRGLDAYEVKDSPLASPSDSEKKW